MVPFVYEFEKMMLKMFNESTQAITFMHKSRSFVFTI